MAQNNEESIMILIHDEDKSQDGLCAGAVQTERDIVITNLQWCENGD